MRIFGWSSIPFGALIVLVSACGDSSGPTTKTPTDLVLVSGDFQPAAEVGTKLPQPLSVKVADAQGRGVAAVQVAWATKAGTLSTASSITDGNGMASVEWTLGTLAGSQTATATVTGVKPLTFTALAVAGSASQIILSRDTIELLGIGDSFRLTARAADKYGNNVSIPAVVEAMDTSIVSVFNLSGGALVVALASDKTTSLRVSAGSLEKIGKVVILPPPCGPASLSTALGVGEIAVFSGSAASEFCVQGTVAGAEFIAVPYYSDLAGTLLRISISTGNTVTAATSNRVIAARLQRTIIAAPPRLKRDEAFETSLRERSRAELQGLIPAARIAKQRDQGAFDIVTAAPAVGDIVNLNTNSSSACSGAQMRAGRIAAISNRAIVVTDTANPANGFSTADFEEIGAAFDTLVYPVDTANFGIPSDVDKNQHVIMFFTRAVNELTPPAANFYVGGFFFSRDLFPSLTVGSIPGCSASNSAEMFYMLAPDPDGVVNQNVRTVSFVKGVTIATLAHEFQHLINASRHLYVNGSTDFEDGFLDEGLSHEAEELAFYRASGLAAGQNLSYQTIQASPRTLNAFNNFAVANFRRLREYMTNPAGNSPYANNANITTRGAIWSFLRYAVDRRGGQESQIWFQLANPPPGIHGISNLMRAITPDLGIWVRDWAVANFTDDFSAGAPAVDTHPSWNLRSVMQVVNEGIWALSTQQLDTTNITSVTVADGGAAYLRFGVRPGTTGGGRIAARAAPVPSAFSLSVIRTK